jgi:hypothetical protein
MKKIIKIIFPIFALAVVVVTTNSVLAYSKSSTSQVLFGSSGSTYLSGTNNFISVNFSNPIGLVGSAGGNDNRWLVVPTNGTVSNLQVKIKTDPGASGSWTATVMVGSTGVTASSMTCSIATGSTSCSDNINTAIPTLGGAIDLKLSPIGNPASTTASFVVTFTPVTSNTVIVGAGGANLTSNPYVTQGLASAGNWFTSTASRIYTLLPMSGTFSNFYGKQQIAQSVGTGWNYVVRNETQNATSSMNVNFLTGNIVSNDLTDTLAVSDGDLIGVVATTTGTPSAVSGSFGIVFTPNTIGDFPIFAGTTGVENNALSMYYPTVGKFATTTLADAQTISNDMTIKKIEARLITAPGSGKSRNYYFMVNGATTTLSCSIADTNTSCSSVGAVVVNKGDLLNFVSEPVGTPAANVGNDIVAVATRYYTPTAKHGVFTGLTRIFKGFFIIK